MTKKSARQASGRRAGRPSSPPATPKPIFQRLERFKTALLSVGAMAAAITAIVTLWPTPDPEDSATVSLRVVPGVPLSEYQQRISTTAVRPQALVSSTHLPSTGSQSRPPSSSAGRTGTGTHSPNSTSTTPPSPTEPANPAITSAGPVATSAPGELRVPAGMTDRDVDDTTETVSRRIKGGPAGIRALETIVVGSSTDQSGKIVPPEEAAKRVLQVLHDARQVEGSTEPVGVVVSADVELNGLRGKTVSLTWSMWQTEGKTRLHGQWLNENLAYNLRPTTGKDTTTVDLWVPLPPGAGTYVIHGDLSTAGAPLASDQSEPFN
jgi:hypothetical protein